MQEVQGQGGIKSTQMGYKRGGKTLRFISKNASEYIKKRGKKGRDKAKKR